MWRIHFLLISLALPSSSFDYDLVIVGAGASGLFASGAARLFGGKTCLVDLERTGGDCTNAACVPSKSFRSVAQQSKNSRECREYIRDTVSMVRDREVLEETPNLDLKLVKRCHFVGRREIELTDASGSQRVTAKKFLIATGADPIVPENLQTAARASKIPLATYRTLLNPDTNDEIWDVLEQAAPKRIVVAGGGATACELIQSLANMRGILEILWVAPSILPGEDTILQQAAYDLLSNHTIFHKGRLVGFQSKCPVVQASDSSTTVLDPVDAILLCLGRSPATKNIQLDAAGVEMDDSDRICVRPDLRSVSNPHVYACGDCCVAPPRHRSASQAAWTGFHAVRNLKVPFLRFGTSFAKNIPRVIYTTCVLLYGVPCSWRTHLFSSPELACVGLTNAECIAKFGIGSFRHQYATEKGTDRADMDRCSRKPGFVELRADRQGRILGCTAFGPAAAEITNSMGMAIENKLTVYDVARAPSSYPSHGYLLYRISLSMALSTSFGLLDAFGFKRISKSALLIARRISFRRISGKQRAIEAEGAETTAICNGRVLSFLDLHQNSTAHVATFQKLLTEDESQRYRRWARKYDDCLK